MRVPSVALAGLLALSIIVPAVSAHHGDTDEAAEAPPNPFAPATLYHHYLLIEEELRQYQQTYPDLFKYKVIGKSVAGLNIYGAHITNFKSTDPPMEDRKRFYFDGSIHSNEQLGMEMAMDIIRFLLEGYKVNATAKAAVEDRQTFVVPLVNPDGNVRDSRQNLHAVDLNRNFPAGWGGPGSAAKGTAPLSEPETQAIAKFLEEVRPHYSNSYHTGTLMLLHPYGYTKDSSPDHAMYTRICQEIQGDMNKANPSGRPVPCGPIYTTIYPASGTTADYVYAEYGANSWTFEVDSEQNLWVHFDARSGDLRGRLGEAWVSVLHAYANIERYGALLDVLEVKTRLKDGAVAGVELKIANQGLGAPNNTVVRLLGADGRSGPSVSVNPPIEPNEVRTVVLPASVDVRAGGRVDVDLSYNKTFFKGYSDHEVVNLQAIKQGATLVLERVQPGAILPLEEPEQASPGFEALLLVASILGGIWVLRRRTA